MFRCSRWSGGPVVLVLVHAATKATECSELSDYQGNTIQEYLSCRDVFVSAPAGAGKSLTFELAPYAFDCLLGEDCKAIVLVFNGSTDFTPERFGL